MKVDRWRTLEGGNSKEKGQYVKNHEMQEQCWYEVWRGDWVRQSEADSMECKSVVKMTSIEGQRYGLLSVWYIQWSSLPYAQPELLIRETRELNKCHLPLLNTKSQLIRSIEHFCLVANTSATYRGKDGIEQIKSIAIVLNFCNIVLICYIQFPIFRLDCAAFHIWIRKRYSQ